MSALGHKLDFSTAGVTSGTTTFYVTAPFDCIVKDVKACCTVDQTTAETLTLADGTTTVGVATFAANAGAGAAMTYVADATDGDTKFDAGDGIKITISALQADSAIHGSIIVDPYCRATQTSS